MQGAGLGRAAVKNADVGQTLKSLSEPLRRPAGGDLLQSDQRLVRDLGGACATPAQTIEGRCGRSV